jgi:hypothetical protein
MVQFIDRIENGIPAKQRFRGSAGGLGMQSVSKLAGPSL